MPQDSPKRDEALEQFRTRWRRWLGNKCRRDGPYWTTLLDTNWLGWVGRTLGDVDDGINLFSSREEIKAAYAKAINVATMDDLRRLDGIYATYRWNI
jgi:hypothetical protein